MRREQRAISQFQTACVFAIGVLALVVAIGPQGRVVAQGENQLTEKELVTLLKFFDGPQIVEKVKDSGVAFSADDEVLARLKKAGASEAVVKAVETAAKNAPSRSAKAVTAADVANLLKADVPEPEILNLLKSSPTQFVLGAAQEKQLRDLGASDRLIAALKGDRPKSGSKRAQISDLAIVLDCSGSMAEKTADGKVKMAVAKNAVTELIEGLPQGLHVTFLIYGHDKQLGCEAVDVVREIAPLDESGKTKLVGYIDKLAPASKTPIALSLNTARKELAKRDSQCGLILISDGKETCDGDPQAEAARLANNLNCQFGVNVVGFDVDAGGRKQLQEVADAGGGEYYNAKNAAELTEAILPDLEKKLDEALEEPAVVVTPSPVAKITVKPLRIKGYPKIERVVLVKAGSYRTVANISPVVSSKELGKPMIAPPGKYDLLFDPSVGDWYEMPIMIKDLELKRQSVTIDPNRLLAGLQVGKIEGIDVESVHILEPNSSRARANWSRVITTEGYGKIMLVPGGKKYDVLLDLAGSSQLSPLADDFVPEGGKLNRIGGKDPFAGADAGNE